MGYRSDVGLVLNKFAADVLKGTLEKTPEVIRKEVEYLLNSYVDERYVHESGAQLWYWSCIKWYPDYDSIDFLERFLGSIDTRHYLFIRIGEETDDIEVQGTYWDNPFNMSIARTISFESYKESE